MALLAPHFDMPFRLSGGPGVRKAYRDLILRWQPQGYWRLGPDPTADASGYGRPLTMLGTSAQATSLIYDPGDAARDFDGSTGYARNQSSNFKAGPKGEFTLGCWFMIDAYPGAGNLAYIYQVGNVGPRFLIDSPGALYSWLNTPATGGAGVGININPTPLIIGNVYHVVGTYDGAIMRTYLNGQARGSAPISGIPDLSAGVSIGSAFGSSFFNGKVDEVTFYNRVLSDEQIALNYNAGLRGSAAQEGVAVTEQNTFEEIANCVEAIVRTPYGFRLDNQFFGIPQLELLTQPILSQVVVDAVAEQEPRSEILMGENRDQFDQFITKLAVEVRQNPEGGTYGLHQNPT